VDEGRGLDILFAAEVLLPAVGGAERLWLEVLGGLAERHAVRAVWLTREAPGDDALHTLPHGVEAAPADAPEPRPDAYWAAKRACGDAVGRAVAGELATRPADVVITTLHSAPATIASARSAGVPAVLALHSYESLCKHAFDAGSRCRPSSHCEDCPRAAALSPSEREGLLASRRAQERGLRDAAALVAASAAVADRCEAWCGRRPAVVPDVTAAHPPVRAQVDGPLVLAAAHWSENKGAALLEPIARGAAPRTLRITERGLSPGARARLENVESVEVVPNRSAADLLHGAGMLLVPSQWPEPFGRLAFEGLSAGVPTLAAAVGGMAEYVPPAQLVRPAGSAAAWLDAIHALEDPARWQAARDDGLAAARDVLAAQPLARWEAILQEIARTGVPA
jgi:hypothetical protein